MLTGEEIRNWGKQPKPDVADVKVPWMIVDCAFCKDYHPCSCDWCDGATWYFRNADTRATVSPMMMDAFDRHG